MAVFLQKAEQDERIEMYLKNDEEIQLVSTASISKEESSEFEMDQIVHAHFGNTTNVAFGPIFRKYHQQEEEDKLRKDSFAAQKLACSMDETSVYERRKAAQVEIFGALRQASLLSEVTGQFRSASLASNSISSLQSGGSHVTVSTSSQTTLFNDADRIMTIQNKVYVSNSIYSNAETILRNIDYLREKLKSRRQQLQYIKQISKSSRKVSYFDKLSQQEHQPVKHQLTQSHGRKVANANLSVVFQKRFNCLQDILAIDCSRNGLYAHPHNAMKLLPIPSIYSTHLLQLAIETPPVYTIQMEILKVKSQVSVASFNSWEGTRMYRQLHSATNEIDFESVNLMDILCAKQEHSNEMFALFKLLVTDTKALPASLVKYIGRLDRQWQEEFVNNIELTYSKIESTELSADSSDGKAKRTEFTVHCGTGNDTDKPAKSQSPTAETIVEGLCVDHILITQQSDDSICCLLNHEYAYKLSLVHQSQQKKIKVKEDKPCSGADHIHPVHIQEKDLTKVLHICMADLKRTYIYHKEIMETYHNEVNILAVKNLARKVPDTVKLLPSSMSLLQCQLLFLELKAFLAATLQKCMNRWNLPIQYEWKESNNMEFKLLSSSDETSIVRNRNRKTHIGIPHNSFVLIPEIHISLELKQMTSTCRKSPFEDPNNTNVYYRSPLSLYFTPTTKGGYCLLKILPEYDDEYSPLNEERSIPTPLEFDAIVSAYTIQYVARLKLDRLTELLIEKVEEKRRRQKLLVSPDAPILTYIWQKGLVIGDFDIINTCTGQVVGIGFPCILKSSEKSTLCSILYCLEFRELVEKENVRNMLKENDQTALIYPNLQNELWDIADSYHWIPSQEQLILDVMTIK